MVLHNDRTEYEMSIGAQHSKVQEKVQDKVQDRWQGSKEITR